MEKSYEFAKKVREQLPYLSSDLSFIESLFTVKRYQECMNLIDDLESKVEIHQKPILHFYDFACRVLKGGKWTKKEQKEISTELYNAITTDELKWNFSGTKKFIQSLESIKLKHILLDIISNVETSQEKNI
jgi:hypothetical protein